MIPTRKPEIFCKDKEKILKKYPKSSEDIKQELKKIAEKPECGDSYPKLKGMRKIRIALKKYGISKRDGLRVIYFCRTAENKNIEEIIFIYLYLKNEIKKEQDVLKECKIRIKAILNGIG